MPSTRAELLIMLTLGVALGSAMTYSKMALHYNKLVKQYNLLIERDAIKARVFKEIVPQLPEGYYLSEKSQTDIAAWNLFHENDL